MPTKSKQMGGALQKINCKLMKNYFIDIELLKSSKIILFLTMVSILFSGCSKEENASDAFGNFDVDETVISAESNGKLELFNIHEGQLLKVGQIIGAIDSTDLLLQRAAILANKQTVLANLTAIDAEVRVLNVQLKVLDKEYRRMIKLLESDAATPKQKDDLEGNVEVIESKIAAAKAQKPKVLAQLAVINANVAQINNQLSKCVIVNPVEGRVLTQLVEQFELVAPGKPLYKIADTDKIYLKAYVTGTQLSGIKLGQSVSVLVDQPDGGLRTMSGNVLWISDQAEFTPKMIQTREERVSLVYAIKVGIDNDGTIKMGMPGEVKF